MYRDEWGYKGNRNGEEAMSKGRKVQREKRNTQVSLENLSIRRALFSRFGN